MNDLPEAVRSVAEHTLLDLHGLRYKCSKVEWAQVEVVIPKVLALLAELPSGNLPIRCCHGCHDHA